MTARRDLLRLRYGDTITSNKQLVSAHRIPVAVNGRMELPLHNKKMRKLGIIWVYAFCATRLCYDSV